MRRDVSDDLMDKTRKIFLSTRKMTGCEHSKGAFDRLRTSQCHPIGPVRNLQPFPAESRRNLTSEKRFKKNIRNNKVEIAETIARWQAHKP